MSCWRDPDSTIYRDRKRIFDIAWLKVMTEKKEGYFIFILCLRVYSV